jgi:dTDP-4-dehydrorhamnose 3,5-epimerase
MRFIPTALAGAFIVELEPRHDHRGYFACSFSKDEFEKHGLCGNFVQSNISWNKQPATLRGMHYQAAPHSQIKLVRCTRGAIYDVILDLRQDSPTFRKWIDIELTPLNHLMLYVPAGCAHGFQTLAPDTEVTYLMSSQFAPAAERAIRWNDPAFGIRWPLPDPIMSGKDRSHPDFVL